MKNSKAARCPRCGNHADHPTGRLLALSRHDNKSKVCEACGMDEALIDAGMKKHQTTIPTWEGK